MPEGTTGVNSEHRAWVGDGEAPRFFFIHMMKTGGGTFRQHVYRNFRAGEVYPDREHDPDMRRANTRLDYLLNISRERRMSTMAYTGHFPFVATDLMGGRFVTITILRHPVERTLSHLKHYKRYRPQCQEMSLEEIYDDHSFFTTLIHNYQSKLFALTAEDYVMSQTHILEVTDDRLAIAKRNLESVDVLGLNEHYGALVEEMQQRFGWQFDAQVQNQHVSDNAWAASPVLLRRIAEDNSADLAFYDHARELFASRQ